MRQSGGVEAKEVDAWGRDYMSLGLFSFLPADFYSIFSSSALFIVDGRPTTRSVGSAYLAAEYTHVCRATEMTMANGMIAYLCISTITMDNSSGRIIVFRPSITPTPTLNTALLPVSLHSTIQQPARQEQSQHYSHPATE